MNHLPENPTGLSPDEIRANNSRLVHLYSLYLNLLADAIDADMVDELSASCNVSRAHAYAYYLAALAGYDAAGKDRTFFEYWIRPSVFELDSADYTQDAYFQNIKIPERTLGKWRLTTGEFRPLEAFVFRDFQVTPDKRLLPQVGFFGDRYTFPAVLENECEWMTLQPNEMTTTAPAIRAAHGRVVTFGLGLGYFAYHAAQKPEVESVTVVDISPDVIELFRREILPQFPNKEKLRLVCMDAFAFANTTLADGYDFAFADIWHDAGDGKELYLKFKEYEKKYPHIDFTYWIEDTIRCYLQADLW